MAPVAPPAKVLVSGINGYLGAWTVRKYLEAGYSVRGTVRSVAKSGPHLKNLFASYGDKFEIVEVKDITAPGAFDEFVKDVDAVAHTASPFSTSSTDVDANVKPAVGGTTSIVESTIAHGKNVKRFILLSTIATAVNGAAVVNETNWNDASVENVKAKGSDAGAWDVYCTSKTLAERAGWDLVAKHKPSWDFVSLNPPYLYGPAIHEVPSVAALNASLGKLYDTIVAGTRSDDRLQNEWGILFDVRDIAQLLVEAMKSPKTGGERFLFAKEMVYDQHVADVANSLNPPPLSSPLTKGVPGSTDGKALPFKLDLEKSAKYFPGFKYTPLEDSIRDSLIYFKEKGFAQ